MPDAEQPVPSPAEQALRAEVVRLNKMVNALMNRAEREASARGSDFGLFQTAVTLENKVRQRTAELEAALRENEKINRALQREKEEQRVLIKKLEEAHNQLLQSEKLASIGQLAAGVAHEINNPIGFVKSNLATLKGNAADLLRLIEAYETAAPLLAADPVQAERIENIGREIDIDFLRDDIGSLIAESIDGTGRVQRIVQDLRDFSRMGDAEWQWADLHAGLESTLNVVWNEIKYKGEVVKEYGALPEVECVPSQLNQVFMNLLVNAAQAIPEKGTITIRTGATDGWAWVAVRDNGCGIPREILNRIFDPFYTTKPVGKGTGLGLSISYNIVTKHGGRIDVESEPGKGTTFRVWLPVEQVKELAS